jgi:hypothetical protein
MIATLSSLEPIQYKAGDRIYKELDEHGEILFISSGETQVGFKINEMEYYAMKYKDKSIIGAYGVTFHSRSQFLFKAAKNCQGVFIRKAKWHEVLGE